MRSEYDTYYQTENLFGAPYPELIEFYEKIDRKGKLLDLGCGQGRDAVALAKMGFEVTGIDHSQVGIAQLNSIAEQEKLPLTGLVADIYKYEGFGEFEFILLDSMFHFEKKDKDQEVGLLTTIIESATPNTLITICIQDAPHKIGVLNSILADQTNLETIHEIGLIYRYEDKASNHSSETAYQMITVRK